MKKFVSIVTALSMIGSCSYVWAVTEDELKAKLDKNNNAIEAKTSEINQAKNKKRSILLCNYDLINRLRLTPYMNTSAAKKQTRAW